MGNLVPALFWLPLALIGIYHIASKEQFLGPGLWYLVASTVVGWLSVNQFGFWQNSAMRKQLENILKTQGEDLSGDVVFAGFASPKYSSMVDAHEDVGFLRISDDRVVFASESRRLELMKSDVTEIRFRPNVHTLIGLGRWISIEAKSGDKPIRLMIEPRERPTMLASRLRSVALFKKLQDWKKPAPPAPRIG